MIRLASPADADAIAALVQSAYRGETSRGGWTTEADLVEGTRTTADEVRALFTDPGVALLVEPDADGLLACCQVSDRGEGLAHFGMFAVRPGAQGGGTGRRMVAAAEAHAAAAFGARAMELQVLEPRGELIAWYERLGYARTGERRPFPTGADVGRLLLDDLRFAVLTKDLPA